MTRKERALKNLKQMCSDGRYLGSGSYVPLEVLEDFDLAIKALEQEPTNSVLKNIKAEISDELVRMYMYRNYANGLGKAIELIDKYMTESEPQKSEDNND